MSCRKNSKTATRLQRLSQHRRIHPGLDTVFVPFLSSETLRHLKHLESYSPDTDTSLTSRLKSYLNGATINQLANHKNAYRQESFLSKS